MAVRSHADAADVVTALHGRTHAAAPFGACGALSARSSAICKPSSCPQRAPRTCLRPTTSMPWAAKESRCAKGAHVSVPAMPSYRTACPLSGLLMERTCVYCLLYFGVGRPTQPCTIAGCYVTSRPRSQDYANLFPFQSGTGRPLPGQPG